MVQAVILVYEQEYNVYDIPVKMSSCDPFLWAHFLRHENDLYISYFGMWNIAIKDINVL